MGKPANKLRGFPGNRDVQSQVSSIYIHIPFCKKKCNYCDFVSYAGKENLIDGYVEALVKEINSPPLSPSLIKRGGNPSDSEGGGELSTIFFGGGTPTLLSPEHFKKILTTLTPYNPPLPEGEGDTLSFCPPSPFGRRGWGMRVLEISLEANPGTADLAKLKALHGLGINRLSIGCQSFNDNHLKTLGRIHNSQQAIQFYKDARSAGFENINLDLIFSLPNQTLDEWKNDLQTAIDLGPEHLSCYSLQIEENTPFWDLTHRTSPSPSGRGGIKGGEGFSLPSEDEEELAMYEFTIETLTKAGYKHYEISNFAKPGFECKHNINYWTMGNWIGIGAGAHSQVDGQRWANPDSIEKYLSSARVGRALSPTVNTNSEIIFMGLRLLDGISTNKFKGFEKEVTELIEQGLLVQDQNNYKLTRKGLYLGNMVFEKFV